MSITYKDLTVKLHSERKNDCNLVVLVYGTEDVYEQSKDTFKAALNRYIAEYNFTQTHLEMISGVSQASISRILSGKRMIRRDSLYAICIALRLHPSRQRHLFQLLEWEMPDGSTTNKFRSLIIRDYLDGCAYHEKFTLSACNSELQKKECRPLSNPFTDTEETK